MKCIPYEYDTRAGKKTVEQASMFDVNKTIMRCLVKNLAMFGLGLYIYAGEDLPEVEKAEMVTATGNNLLEMIANCQSEDQLQVIYRSNKQFVTANPDILDAITLKGKELKRK